MDWKESLGTIMAGIALLVPAIKWLISDWAKKAEQLEKLKVQYATTALDRLESDVRNFRISIDTIKEKLSELSKQLTENRADVIVLKERLIDAKQAMEKHTRDISGQIRGLVKTEMIELGKQAQMIRDRDKKES